MKLQDSAIKWGEMGMSVFPLKTKSKIPATKNGFYDSTTDTNQIKKYFTNDNVNIGLSTGIKSNLIVIDIDIKGGKNGIESLTNHFGKDFLLPKDSMLFKTPSGGLHVPVRWHEDIDIGCGVNVLGIDGVDLRGNGGYIVAPPSSILIDNKVMHYRINDINYPITEHYGWITKLLTQFKSSKNKSKFNPTIPMVGVNSGERNSTLFSYARHLCVRGFDKGLVIGFVMEAAKRCKPPLNESETKKLIESAFSYSCTSLVKKKENQTLEGLLS